MSIIWLGVILMSAVTHSELSLSSRYGTNGLGSHLPQNWTFGASMVRDITRVIT